MRPCLLILLLALAAALAACGESPPPPPPKSPLVLVVVNKSQFDFSHLYLHHSVGDYRGQTDRLSRSLKVGESVTFHEPVISKGDWFVTVTRVKILLDEVAVTTARALTLTSGTYQLWVFDESFRLWDPILVDAGLGDGRRDGPGTKGGDLTLDARPPDARPPDARPSDARPSDARPPDARPPEVRPPDTRPPDAAGGDRSLTQ